MAPTKKVMFTFPGQGAQIVGMQGPRNAISNEVFQTAERILGYDLREICASQPEQLNSTRYSQPAILVCSWICWLQLKASKPELFDDDVEFWFAGLSLGEYTALAAAGVMSFEDCLKLVKVRAEAMDEATMETHGGMLTVIGLDSRVLENVCGESGYNVCVANYLFPRCQVLSGEKNHLESIREECTTAGATMCRELNVTGAFHTSYMQSASEELRRALEDVTIAPRAAGSRTKVFANTTGKVYEDLSKESVTNSLSEQLVSPVQWNATLQAMSADFNDGDLIFEVGPGKQIGSMLRRVNKSLMKSYTSISVPTRVEQIPVKKFSPKRPVTSPKGSTTSPQRILLQNTTNRISSKLRQFPKQHVL